MSQLTKMSSLVKRTVCMLMLALLCLSIFTSNSKPVSAVTASDWQAGNIIDDSVFFNKNSMSPHDIQAFLESKETGCTQVCLKNYYEHPVTKANNIGGGQVPSGAFSAALIIYGAAQEHSINPQVLIVKLQKEQGLVTNTAPSAAKYRSAMGMGCPDTAACDAQYYGFYNQVYYGARQLRKYTDNPTGYRYKSGVVNSINYNVESLGCPKSDVYIQNQATANLYNYTPYQPNQAALNNIYGEGDRCSAYGNRNFWRFFSDWFGTTRGALFEAQFHSQSASINAYAGETKTAYIQYRNTGQWDWHDDQINWPGIPPIHLAATSPINRTSTFSYGWPSGGRPNLNFSKVYESNGTTLAANQHLAKSGQIVRFEFNISIPWTLPAGQYREHFQPVLEGADGWNIGGLAWLDINVQQTNRADFNGQSPYPTMPQNSTKDVYLQYQNNGNTTWYDDTNAAANNTKPVRLAASGPVNRVSDFSAAWPSGGRPNTTFSKVYESNGTTLAANQHVVLPSQIARFEFTMTASSNKPSGQYREYFQPVLEGSANWSMGGVAWLDTTVTNNATAASFNGQSNFPVLTKGASTPVFLQYKNTGQSDWYDSQSAPRGINPVHLAASAPINRTSGFSFTWPSGGRPNTTFSKVYESNGTTLAANQHVVKPGQIAKFEFSMTSPWVIQSGVYREYFQPVLEGASNWSIGGVSWLDTRVN